MPYKVVRYKTGFSVMNTNTGKMHSTEAMTKRNANKQLKILNAAEAGHPIGGKASKRKGRR